MNDQSSVQLYISQCRAQGMNSEKIISSLISSGWSEEDARKALSGGISNQSRLNKWWIIILVVVLLGAGAVYWFVFRQQDDTNTQTTNVNSPTVAVNNSNSVQITNDDGNLEVARVFGTSIFQSDIENMALMFLDLDYMSYSGVVEYLDQSAEMAALSSYMDSLVYQEAIRRIGGTPMTDTEYSEWYRTIMSDEDWNFVLEQGGLEEQHLDMVKEFRINGMRELEFHELVNDELQPEFNTMVGERIIAVYNAFEKKLEYLTDEEKEDLEIYFSPWIDPGDELFPYMDDYYLINEHDALIEDVDIPEQLKTELLVLEETPNTLTSFIEEDGYYYFGMVFNPSEYGFQSDGFYLDETMIVRFPALDYTYESLLINLVWEDGVDNNEIQIFETPGLKLDSLDNYADTDGDGLKNYVEWVYDSYTTEVDSDNDGKTDKEEYEAGTNPIEVK
ncbi:hypothetical protein ACFL0L_03360 [Patescibacteria group bacterium]